MSEASRTPISFTQQPSKGSAPLSREAEYKLALLWRDQRSASAADKLVRAHLRFVIATANKYRRYGIPVDELVSEGNFGLAHALEKFDPERGFRFVTYAAYWVRAYILNYVIRSWSMVGAGSGALRSKSFFRLRRERAQIANLTEDRDEQERLLAERLNVTPSQVKSMLRQLDARDVSLDTQVFDDSGETLGDRLVSPTRDQELRLSDLETHTKLKSVVGGAVRTLDARERFIVERRLMAETEDKLSLAAIGRHLGVSRERTRQLETRAKNKLRSQLVSMPEEAKPDWLAPKLRLQLSAA